MYTTETTVCLARDLYQAALHGVFAPTVECGSVWRMVVSRLWIKIRLALPYALRNHNAQYILDSISQDFELSIIPENRMNLQL
jgi:hypothetical protein